MSVDQMLIARVREEALDISIDEVVVPESAIGVFIEDYRHFVAKLQEDRLDFIAAKWGVENVDYAQAVLQELLTAQSGVLISSKDLSEWQAVWEQERAFLLHTECKLVAAARDLTYDHPELMRIVREIELGSSNMDSINNLFLGVQLGRRFLGHFASITIEGDILDVEYLDKVEKKADELLQLLNKIDTGCIVKSQEINYRNRLIILAQRVMNQTQRELQLVFSNRQDRINAYNRHKTTFDKRIDALIVHM